MPDEHKITKSRLVTVLSVGLIDRFRKMGRRNRAHSAGERHSGLSQGASIQVVLAGVMDPILVLSLSASSPADRCGDGENPGFPGG